MKRNGIHLAEDDSAGRAGFRSLRALGDLADPDPPGVRARHYLHPGEAIASVTPHAVTTILASCVAVCLFDAERRVGGVAHFLLPMGARNAARPARYANHAIPRLVADLVALGCWRQRLRAKIFGGSCRARSTAAGDLGTRNVAVAEEELAAFEIPVIARDVGGARSRKLVVHTDDFSVWVWRL